MVTARKNGCAGLCCTSFVLHAGKTQLTAKLFTERRLKWLRGEWIVQDDRSADSNKVDMAFMPVSKDRFSCNWFDPETKMCGDYENRPDTCRKFGRTCSREGCEYGRSRKSLPQTHLHSISLRPPNTDSSR